MFNSAGILLKYSKKFENAFLLHFGSTIVEKVRKPILQYIWYAYGSKILYISKPQSIEAYRKVNV